MTHRGLSFPVAFAPARAVGRAPSGSQAGFLPQTRALLARYSSQPDNAQARRLDALFGGLIDADLLDLWDALYVHGAHDAQAGRQNIIQDAYNLTVSGTVTFEAYRGHTGDGSTGYLATAANPSTLNSGSGKLKQNSASLFYWNLTSGYSATSCALGCRQSATNFFDFTRDDGLFYRPRLNIAPATSTQASGAGTATLHLASRTSSTNVDLYRAGSAVASFTHTSNAPPNAAILILAQGVDSSSAGAFSPNQMLFSGFGGALTAQNAADLYTILNAYKTGVGA